MDARPLNVLITSPQWQSALACIQSMGRSGHRVYLWGDTANNPNLHSRYVYKRLVRSSSDIEDQSLELMRIIDDHAIDLVVPISDQDAEVAARVNAKLNSTHCIVGSVDAVALMRDRTKTYEFCRALGLPVPKSSPATADEAVSVAGGIGYPCFLKLSHTVGSQGVFRLADRDALVSTLARVNPSRPFQIQEEMRGKLSDITGFARNGVLIDSFSFETDYEHSHGGNPPYAREVRDPALHRILDAVVSALEWTGGIDIDLLTDASGNHYILEINPRLSGTSVFAYKLGVDFPRCYIDAHKGFSPEKRSPRTAHEICSYVSLAEEAAFLGANPHRSSRVKSGDLENVLDNAFPDDPGYSKALSAWGRRLFLIMRYPRLAGILRVLRNMFASAFRSATRLAKQRVRSQQELPPCHSATRSAAPESRPDR